MQLAFRTQHSQERGFCTYAMIMTGIDIENRQVTPDRETIRAELKGNICRCTGYHNIVTAIEAGAADMAKAGE
jgi:carbon-monoxide dehydrogenase small subunit